MNYPQKIFNDLIFMIRPLETQLSDLLRKQGMQRLEWSVFYAIIHNPSLTAAELAQRLTIEKSNIAPIIKDLVHAGYVNVETSKVDKRRKNLLITPEGMNKYKAIRVHIDAFQEEIVDGVTEEESKYLFRTIEKMKNNLHKRAGYKE